MLVELSTTSGSLQLCPEIIRNILIDIAVFYGRLYKVLTAIPASKTTICTYIRRICFTKTMQKNKITTKITTSFTSFQKVCVYMSGFREPDV